MRLARVAGTIVSTVKDGGLAGQRLLVLQPLGFDGAPEGDPVVATDTVRAGTSEVVVFVRGKEASYAHRPDAVVTDAAVVGVVEAHHLPRRA